MTARTLIAVPVKDPSVAKVRLASDLSKPARSRLASVMLRRTLVFLAPGIRAGWDLAVVTSSTQVARVAQAMGVNVIREQRAAGLNSAGDEAIDWADRAGYERLALIPSDLIDPIAEDLAQLLASNTQVTICPAHDGGTNALVVTLPYSAGLFYGPNSAQLHYDAAKAAGLTPSFCYAKSFQYDLDTAAQLGPAIREYPDLAQAIRDN